MGDNKTIIIRTPIFGDQALKKKSHASLVVLKGEEIGRDFRLRKRGMVIGRSTTADICLPGEGGGHGQPSDRTARSDPPAVARESAPPSSPGKSPGASAASSNRTPAPRKSSEAPWPAHNSPVVSYHETTPVLFRVSLEGAVRCSICGARLHQKSITVDHVQRKQDGGTGSVDNAQLAHGYCNSGYKESQRVRDGS